jgi:hypothetical protein
MLRNLEHYSIHKLNCTCNQLSSVNFLFSRTVFHFILEDRLRKKIELGSALGMVSTSTIWSNSW